MVLSNEGADNVRAMERKYPEKQRYIILYLLRKDAMTEKMLSKCNTKRIVK